MIVRLFAYPRSTPRLKAHSLSFLAQDASSIDFPPASSKRRLTNDLLPRVSSSSRTFALIPKASPITLRTIGEQVGERGHGGDGRMRRSQRSGRLTEKRDAATVFGAFRFCLVFSLSLFCFLFSPFFADGHRFNPLRSGCGRSSPFTSKNAGYLEEDSGNPSRKRLMWLNFVIDYLRAVAADLTKCQSTRGARAGPFHLA